MLIAAIILLGYLLAQFVAIRLRRPWRLRFDALRQEMFGEGYLPIEDWRRIEFYRTASYGGWATLRRFARTPSRMLRVEARDEEPPYHPRIVLLREMHALTANLEWARYPVCFVLMVIASAPLMVIGRAMSRAQGVKLRPGLADIRRVASSELRAEAEAACHRMLEPAEVLALQTPLGRRPDARPARRS